MLQKGSHVCDPMVTCVAKCELYGDLVNDFRSAQPHLKAIINWANRNGAEFFSHCVGHSWG